MGTIADKLEYLNDTKQEIKEAIVNKGQSIADTDTFRSYADKINKIVVSKTQSKTQTITSNTTTTIKPDSGYTGLSQVTVTTSVAMIPTSSKVVCTVGRHNGWSGGKTATISGLPGKKCTLIISIAGINNEPEVTSTGENYITINNLGVTLVDSVATDGCYMKICKLVLDTTSTTATLRWCQHELGWIRIIAMY